jgi:hypothetical protein
MLEGYFYYCTSTYNDFVMVDRGSDVPVIEMLHQNQQGFGKSIEELISNASQVPNLTF